MRMNTHLFSNAATY